MAGSLVMAGDLYKRLLSHVHPGDNVEAAAILFCHSGRGRQGFRLVANECVTIPPSECPYRSTSRVSWNFGKFFPPEKIEEIDKRGLSIVTVHSHPDGYADFSHVDDETDRSLFRSVCNWFDDGRPNGSAVMLPDGEVIARTVDAAGGFDPIESVCVVSDSIRMWKNVCRDEKAPGGGLRIMQTFGKGTFALLRRLRVGVVGCSGTGSIIAELLARNCVGHLVLVDPDFVEEKNLNRIVNAGRRDSERKTPKVEAIKKAVEAMGTEVRVETCQADTTDPDVVEALVDCDVIFGCVDSARGRYHLECIATAYFLPYFDVGVNLEADGKGGITQADAVAHYVHPQNASLVSRGAYTIEQVTAESWRHADKDYYEAQRAAGYLAAVGEDQPAVMSVNMQAACMAFNDFMSRLHNFRLDENAEFAVQRFRLVHGFYVNERADGCPAPLFQKYLGMGDRSFLIQSLKKNADQNHQPA